MFGDISQGCQWNPQAGSVQVCGQTTGPASCSGSQCGCQLGGGATWSLLPTYLPDQNVSVGNWTNDTTCANANGLNQQTTAGAIHRWLAQSIADQGQGASPTYQFPGTGISAWLCRSVHNTSPFDCSTGYNPNYCANNSTPQGQLFYQNIVSTSLPPNYAIYAVDLCTGSEGFDGMYSNVPGFYPPLFGGTGTGGGTINGHLALEYDMLGYQNSAGTVQGQCFRRAH